MDPTQFLSTLLAIIVIDLVLAGDNAIVIALAARALPTYLRKRAIVWGAIGAIGVRSLMTVVVVWLLKIPGLLAAGGLMLLWIAYALLKPDETQDQVQGPTVTTFWGAIRTIVVADAVMGLDNVLAVAGAAHGSYLLVVVGLVVSVPIVVWGSTVVLKVVDRYPAVVYLGAGVLAWTAVKMVVGEPLLSGWFAASPPLALAPYLAVPAVLWTGFVKNHRQLESRIRARLASFAAMLPAGASRDLEKSAVCTMISNHEGDQGMLKILVPVDGSANALGAVRHVIAEYRRQHQLEVHLINVQPRLSRHIARFVGRRDRESWHRDQAHAALAGAVHLLRQDGVPHHTHWTTGDRVEAICNMARQLAVHHIVMGTARKNSITRMLEASITNSVLEATPVPVEVVAGNTVSKWERWGLPAGVLGVGGLLLFALD